MMNGYKSAGNRDDCQGSENYEIFAQLMSAGIDVNGSLKRMMNREDIYLKYLRRFAESPEFDRLAEAFAGNDCELAFREAHNYRGSTGNMGITPMYELLVDMTEALRNGTFNDLEGQRSEFERLKGLHDSICSAILEILK